MEFFCSGYEIVKIFFEVLAKKIIFAHAEYYS